MFYLQILSNLTYCEIYYLTDWFICHDEGILPEFVSVFIVFKASILELFN